MTNIQDFVIEDALREIGWVQDDNRVWTNPAHPGANFADTIDVVFTEWRQALSRAGRADAAVSKIRRELATLCLTLVAGIGFVTIVKVAITYLN